MPFLEAASKCLKCPDERIILVEDSGNFDLAKIRDGIVIFFASWSSPAHVALNSYMGKLTRLKQTVPVWILNMDTLTDEVDKKFNGAKHGYGETFFFRDGAQVDELLSLEGDYGEHFRLKYQALFSQL